MERGVGFHSVTTPSSPNLTLTNYALFSPSFLPLNYMTITPLKRDFEPESSLSTPTLSPLSKKHALPMTSSATINATSFLVQRLSSNAKLPTRGSALAAGYDLYSAEKKLVPAGGKALINTELSIAVPEGTYGRIAPRSGLGSFLLLLCLRPSS